LPGNSTFGPLRIINEIIQDVNENDKDLWILSLDMSKAYDRVNIFMLEKAMELLKLPLSFINIIKSLVLNQTNRVFTAKGLMDPYNMLVGIDQGEIISPLLWCIYYDPLLCRLQRTNLGYEISSNKIIDLYNEECEKISINISFMAYMDDTNIISNNKTNLEEMLNILNDFNVLNDIQINKEKSELLLKTHSMKSKVKIVFGNQTIKISPIKCILGV
jgi:hypothetical protein